MKLSVLIGVCFFVLASSVYAAESQFGFIYTTDLLPKGEKEIEQWLTWRTQKIAGSFNLLEGRTAYEYGLADNVQIALYATYDWMQAYHNGPFGATTPAEPFSYDQPKPDDHYSATRFIGVSFESIFRLLSPYLDPVGLALYVEPTVGNKFLEVENKIILQKNFLDDTLITGFNFTYAPEFRFLSPDPGSADTSQQWQEETDLNLNFGASYRFRENWFAGFELLNERELDGLGFSHEMNSGYFFGPSVHYGAKSYFVTAVFLTQLPWASVHENSVPGAIFNGYDFDNDFEKYRLRFKIGFYL